MMSNLQIAQDARLQPIAGIAEAAGLLDDEVEPYGRHKGKVSLDVLDRLADRPDGKLICVAGMTPTRFGEGKSTTSVGLTQGLGHIGKDPMLCMREASLGPVFGLKGGAAGGGLRPGRADGGPQPSLHRGHPRDRRREQHARGDHRLAHPARQRAEHRSADRLVASRGRHQRSRTAPDRGRARGLGQRIPARVGLRHHRGVGGDGDPRRRSRPVRPPPPPRRDHRRLHLRRQARDGRGPACGGLDVRAAQGRDQAQPRADARGSAGAHALRAVRQHRPRQQLAGRRPRGAEAVATTSSPSRGSGPTWAWRSSWTSCAGSVD